MPEQWIPDPGMRLRIAAALVLTDKKPADVAPELNVSARTLERVIAGDRLPREWEVQRLAAILDVPLWFLMEGLTAVERPSEDDRLTVLEQLARSIDRKLDTLDVADRMAAIEEAIREATAALRSRSS